MPEGRERGRRGGESEKGKRESRERERVKREGREKGDEAGD
jgi:hypothetical protein